MDEVRDKLAKCLSLTFPGLNPSEVLSASINTVSDWDSVRHVTLLSLIGEEFGIDIDFVAFAGLTSFDELAQRLSQEVHT